MQQTSLLRDRPTAGWHGPASCSSSSQRPVAPCFARARKTTPASFTAGSNDSNGHDPDKAKKLEVMRSIIANLNSKHGNNTLMNCADKPTENIQRFSSGCLALDAALGGGFPKGRIVEIYGPESCGKTTLALHAVAEMQRLGHMCVIVDVEQALDLNHAKKLGVDITSDQLFVSQPSYGEEALDIVNECAAGGVVGLIVVDSVSALVPRSELEGDMGATQVGTQARLMSLALRKLVATANKGNCTIIFINQLRQKVGVLYGNPETTSGGVALKFYASVRIDLRKKDQIKVGEEVKGIKVKAKVVKNKVAPPFREAPFDILFDKGIDSVGSLLDVAETLGVIKRRGAYYFYNEQRLGQGRDSSVDTLRKNEVMQAEVNKTVQSLLASSPGITLTDEDEREIAEQEDDDFLSSLEPIKASVDSVKNAKNGKALRQSPESARSEQSVKSELSGESDLNATGTT